jgi:hypothetical protein
MLTVKHVTPTHSESIYEADDVAFTMNESQGSGQPPGVVWVTRPDQPAIISLIDGAVYVMNSSGSTVAKYDLGGWDAPRKAPLVSASGA